MVGGALGRRAGGGDRPVRRAESLDADAAECLTGRMSESSRIVSAERRIAAPAADIFELIADPAQQPRWDGNDNLSEGAPDQRVHAVGEIFVMTNLGDRRRENHVVEFVEARLIAWKPALPGEAPFGQLWRWGSSRRMTDPRSYGTATTGPILTRSPSRSAPSAHGTPRPRNSDPRSTASRRSPNASSARRPVLVGRRLPVSARRTRLPATGLDAAGSLTPQVARYAPR